MDAVRPRARGCRSAAILFVVAAALAPEAGQAADPRAAAKVLSVTGALQVNGRLAGAGTLLRRGDRLATGPASRAFIGFSDGSALRLNADSRLDLSRLTGWTELALRSGSVLNAVHKGSRYSVTGPRAVAAVRGTVLYVEATPARPGYTCVCEGSVEVRARGRQARQVVTSQEHAAVEVGPDGLKPAGMEGHTDDDIRELKRHAR
jgi:ferric-dicitrate binding protein FerR (iron transport regulator)